MTQMKKKDLNLHFRGRRVNPHRWFPRIIFHDKLKNKFGIEGGRALDEEAVL